MPLVPMRLLRIPEPFNDALRLCQPGQPASSDFGRRCLFLLLVCVAVVGCASCDRPLRSGALLAAYRAAACVVPTFAKGVEPPTRGWDSTIVIANGSNATIGALRWSGDR